MGRRSRRPAGRGRPRRPDEGDRPGLPRPRGRADPSIRRRRAGRSLHVHGGRRALAEPAVGSPGDIRFGASGLGMERDRADVRSRDRGRLLLLVSELPAGRRRSSDGGDPHDPRVRRGGRLARRAAPSACGAAVHRDVAAPGPSGPLDVARAAPGRGVGQRPRQLRPGARPRRVRAGRRSPRSPAGGSRSRRVPRDDLRHVPDAVRSLGLVLRPGRRDRRHDPAHRRGVAAAVAALRGRGALLGVGSGGGRPRPLAPIGGADPRCSPTPPVLRARRRRAPLHGVVGTGRGADRRGMAGLAGALRGAADHRRSVDIAGRATGANADRGRLAGRAGARVRRGIRHRPRHRRAAPSRRGRARDPGRSSSCSSRSGPGSSTRCRTTP